MEDCMSTATKEDPQNIVTGVVRLSYVNLFKPRMRGEGDAAREQYSVLLLVPKSDKETVAKISAAIKAAKEEKWGNKIPPNLKSIVKDGDAREDLDERPEYAGHYYMSVSSNTQPGVVGRDPSIAIQDPTEVYSGCYAKVALRCAGYDKEVNRGTTFYLNHVQKVKDGEPLGSVTRAEDVFEALGAEYDDEFGASAPADGSDLL
jgi:hypothetical protein